MRCDHLQDTLSIALHRPTVLRKFLRSPYSLTQGAVWSTTTQAAGSGPSVLPLKLLRGWMGI